MEKLVPQSWPTNVLGAEGRSSTEEISKTISFWYFVIINDQRFDGSAGEPVRFYTPNESELVLLAYMQWDFLPSIQITSWKFANCWRFGNHTVMSTLKWLFAPMCVEAVVFLQFEFCSTMCLMWLQELCYDYGYALNSVVAADGTVKEVACHCGSLICRKRMY
jgi:hypothetical protein